MIFGLGTHNCESVMFFENVMEKASQIKLFLVMYVRVRHVLTKAPNHDMLYNDPTDLCKAASCFRDPMQPAYYLHKKIHISSLCLLLNLITKEFLVCSHTDTNQQLQVYFSFSLGKISPKDGDSKGKKRKKRSLEITPYHYIAFVLAELQYYQLGTTKPQ